jgi:hypothetical protein
MVAQHLSPISRRSVLAGALAATTLALPGCTRGGYGFSLVDAIRRLLEISSANALARLSAPGGFWDNQAARLDLPEVFGGRGAVLQNILTSVVFKNRLQRELNYVAERGARRAAPVLADAVRVIGIDNAVDLVRGGPSAASLHLRQAMGGRLVETMVPELGDGLRLANDPIVGQALAALTGVDVGGVARSLAYKADDAIWGEIGREEAYIRANPRVTNDPLLIGVFSAL